MRGAHFFLAIGAVREVRRGTWRLQECTPWIAAHGWLIENEYECEAGSERWA